MGGIFDHLDGGFFRYSRDENWPVPHFEKMIPGKLSSSLVFPEPFENTKNLCIKKLFQKPSNGYWIRLAMRKLVSPSSVSSESEGQEGKFYLWTKENSKKF